MNGRYLMRSTISKVFQGKSEVVAMSFPDEGLNKFNEPQSRQFCWYCQHWGDLGFNMNQCSIEAWDISGSKKATVLTETENMFSVHDWKVEPNLMAVDIKIK